MEKPGPLPIEPMDNNTTNIIQQIHASPSKIVITVAGAGSLAIRWLLGVSGASNTVLEAMIPYSKQSMAEHLGSQPLDQSVSLTTGTQMARKAYKRATQLRSDMSSPAIGVACTATIATDREKRGSHRGYIVIWTAVGSQNYMFELDKGLNDRDAEELLVSQLLIQAIGIAAGLKSQVDIELTSNESLIVTGITYKDSINSLLVEHIDTVTVCPDGTLIENGRFEGAILAGSFDPPHRGHWELAEITSKLLSRPVNFELSILNVDKPSLQEPEIRTRMNEFANKATLLITRTPVFNQKSRYFPNCTFVMGWDTADRLVDVKYYNGSISNMMSALEQIRNNNCRFLVAGREVNGVFQTLQDISIPANMADIFTEIPESAFRHDLSSSMIRATNHTKGDRKIQ